MTDYSVYSTPCAVCIRALSYTGPSDDRTKLPHHLTYESLLASAKEGCYICTAVHEDVQSGSENGDSERAFVNDVLIDALRSAKSVTSFKPITLNSLDGIQESRLNIYNSTTVSERYQTFVLSPVPGKAESVGKPMDSLEKASTEDEASWEKVRSWLNECTLKHSSCRAPPIAQDSHPSRFLFIENASSEYIRVVSTSNIDFQVERFIALSHRWQPYVGECRLVAENLTAYSNPGIKISSLPQTFQDVVTICRRLGIKYLWIDAMCIIQDSKSDWISQSAIMGTVYQSAYLIIAAITSANPQPNGLFKIHSKSSIVPCLYRPAPSLSTSKSTAPIYQVHDSSIWVRSIVNSPLAVRGWCFQERLLPLRSLFFTNNQLFWECGQGQYCESHPTPIPFTDRLHWYPENFNTVATACSSHSPSTRWNNDKLIRYNPREEAQAYWGNLLNNYSRCSLTFPSDKLVAVSGLARKMAPLMDSSYLAGLWKQSLPAGLCWESLAPSTTSVEYRAPSWSWASSDGPGLGSYWESPGAVNLVEVVRTEVLQVEGADAFGPVRGGYILLRGKVAVMEWGWKYDASQRTVYSAWMKIGDDRFSENLFTVIRPDSIEEIGIEGLVFCPITYIDGRVYALVLRKCSEGYRRVGLIWHFNGLDAVNGWLSRTKDVGGFETYEEKTGTCLIKVV